MNDSIKELLPENGVKMDVKVDQIYQEFFKEVVESKNLETYKENKSFSRLLAMRTNQTEEIHPTAEDIWIFGYGSLVWKADFPYIDRKRGFICGYQRRFYQHSIDHRGVPSRPGRVVTLLPTAVLTDRVYGMGYRIAAAQKQEVLQHLDYREKNGYERCTLKFYEFPESSDGANCDIIMYIATQENESYAGAVWQVPLIAKQIFTSAGPSGRNREYLFNLANAMRELFPGVEDEHLFELESEVLRRIENDEMKALERALKKEIAAAMVTRNCNEENGGKTLEAVNCFEMLRMCCEKPGWKEALLTKELLPQHI